MDLINVLIEQYAKNHSSAEDNLLAEINKDTTENHPQAHMLSGTIQGQFLTFISQLISPKNILEIGTFTGYSALCLAKGLAKDGVLHTIELREKDAVTAYENFSKSKQINQIVLHTGNAVDILPTLNHLIWDLVFIDADKIGYINYYEMVLPNLSSNGLIIVDNVLFHGQILDNPIKNKNAIAIDKFNKHIVMDDRVEQVMLTVRDGLLLIKKKN